MGDGAAFTPSFAATPLLLDPPRELFTGSRAAIAYRLAQAQVDTHLRYYLNPNASRSSLRLHPWHEALAWALACLESEHAEVHSIVAGAAHDGRALMDLGPTRASELLIQELHSVQHPTPGLGTWLARAMETVSLAQALSWLHNGEVDERGFRVGQVNGKSITLIPSETRSEGAMEINTDVTVMSTDSSLISLVGRRQIHLPLSLLEACIPVEHLGEHWVAMLQGSWRKGHTIRLDITLNEGMVDFRLARGSFRTLNGAQLTCANQPYVITLKEPACAKVSTKAPMRSLAGNTGTTMHSMHSEAGSVQAMALVHALPLISSNGRSGADVEHPGSSTVKAAECCAASEAKALEEGGEVPCGLSFMSLMMPTPHSMELVETHFPGNTLACLAYSTLLQRIAHRTRATEKSQHFIQTVQALAQAILVKVDPFHAAQWPHVQWVGLGSLTPSGIPLSRQDINTLQDRLQREPHCQWAAMGLSQAGADMPAPLKLPTRWPACWQDRSAMEGWFKRLAQWSCARSPTQALARLSEIRHQQRCPRNAL